MQSALVLAAGLGTRLHPLTTVRAKAAVPVAGEPVVRRITRWLVSHGIQDMVVNLHHLPETITAVLGDGADLGARVRYSWEQPMVLGSAGGPRQALPILGADTFYIVNGDTLTDLDLGALGAAHTQSGALVTMAVTRNHDPERYGGVLLDGTRVTGFASRGAAAAGSCHFIGAQVAAASVFRDLPEARAIASVGDVYDRLLASRPGSVRAFPCDATFWDIGSVAEYVRTSRAFGAGTHQPITWDDVVVGDGATVESCILTDGVRVPAGAVHRHEILMRGPNGTVISSPWTDDRG